MATSIAAERPHAFLGGSNYHWLNWSDDKLLERYQNHRAAQKGTELHSLAENLIRLNVNLPDDEKTLSMYVNDAIRYQLDTEVFLYYSDFIYGTADALGFDGTCLRISDYKSGVTKASMMQLYFYAAVFCLTGNNNRPINPYSINIILRIYQSNDVITKCPDPEEILKVMDRIQEANHILTRATADQ